MSEVKFSEPLILKSGFRLPSRVLLSPMEGITTPGLVQMASELRLIDCWMTPFLSVTGGNIPSKPVLKRRIQPYVETGLPLIVQLVGRNESVLSETAERLVKLGVSAINLNLACPSPTVTGNGAGGALLKNADTVHKMVSGIRNCLPPEISLSVKLRAGWDHPEVRLLIQAVEDAEWIVFHYRTVSEMYHPITDGLDRLAEAVASAQVPVFGNGDLTSVSSAEDMVRRCHCSGVALARAFLKDPSLPARICGTKREISASALLQAMARIGTPLPPLLEFAKQALSPEKFRKFLNTSSRPNKDSICSPDTADPHIIRNPN